MLEVPEGIEIAAISAQPTEVGVGLSWAELGNKIVVHIES